MRSFAQVSRFEASRSHCVKHELLGRYRQHAADVTRHHVHRVSARCACSAILDLCAGVDDGEGFVVGVDDLDDVCKSFGTIRNFGIRRKFLNEFPTCIIIIIIFGDVLTFKKGQNIYHVESKNARPIHCQEW